MNYKPPQQRKPEVKTRKVRFLMVEPGMFMAMFTKGLRIRSGMKITEGVPKDAKLLTVTYDARLNAILLVVESEEYDAIPVTKMPPVQEIEIQLKWASLINASIVAITTKRKTNVASVESSILWKRTWQ